MTYQADRNVLDFISTTPLAYGNTQGISGVNGTLVGTFGNFVQTDSTYQPAFSNNVTGNGRSGLDFSARGSTSNFWMVASNNLPFTPATTLGHSVMILVRLTAIKPDARTLYHFATSAGNNSWIMNINDSNVFNAAYNNGGTSVFNVNSTSTYAVPLNQWTVVGVRYDGSGSLGVTQLMRNYDQVAISTSATKLTNRTYAANTSAFIGRRYANTLHFGDGQIGAMAFFDRYLTDTEWNQTTSYFLYGRPYITQVERMLEPRSYIFSSNMETLVLDSSTPQTKLTFVNATRTSPSSLAPSFTVGSSNTDFELYKDGTRISTFNVNYEPRLLASQPRFTTYGGVHASNFTVMQGSGSKAIVIQDYNTLTDNEYAGLSFSSGTMVHQLPARTSKFIFQAAAMGGINAEWMRIQEGASGLAQVGIGTTSMASSVALAISGDTHISGSLKVTGDVDLNPATFSDFIRYDSNTQRLPFQSLPSNVAILNTNNKIDESLIPQSFNFQYIKSQKNVGIGTKQPLQKFHVHGTSVFSERVGVGTLSPATRLHVVESSASIPAVKIQSIGGGAVLESYCGGAYALLVPGTHPAIGINTSVVPVSQSLFVNGNAYITGTVGCSNMNVFNKLTIGEVDIIDNLGRGVFRTGLLTSTQFGQVQTVESFAPMLVREPIAVNTITPINTGLVTFRNASVLVDRTAYVSTQAVTLAHDSLMTDRNVLLQSDALNVVKLIPCYTYNLNGGGLCAGVSGLDLYGLGMNTMVTSMPDGKYGVRYDSIIPYLVQSIKELERRLRILETSG